MKSYLQRCLTVLVLTVLSQFEITSALAHDAIYWNGDILTMAGDSPEYVEAIVVEGGKISFAGTKTEAMRRKRDGLEIVDLQSHTLLPGFIDSHGHMVYFGKNLMDQSLSGVHDIPELISRMKQHVAQVPGDGWIVGMGYAPLKMQEQRHPTADELDQISAERPVLVVHGSGHGGSMNHALMRLLKIDESTSDPEGGEFVRVPETRRPLGPMEETALINVRSLRPPFTGEAASRVIIEAARIWASHGQTTAQEGGLGLGADDIDIVRNAIEHQLLPIDLVVYAKESATEAVIQEAYNVTQKYSSAVGGSAEEILASRPDMEDRYINRVRLGGIKMWLDGNPVLAWMSKPFMNPPAGREAGYRGYGQISDEMIFAFFDRYWTTNRQITMHVMGDEATEQALRAIEAAIAKHGMSDHRPVFVHAGYVRPDQIARIKAVGGVPSFLMYCLRIQGDEMAPMWGPERADNAMAANSMLVADVPFTLHHDAPITAPSVLPGVEAAVTRLTTAGKVLGPDQRISPYHALRAVTATAAWQIREENTKGTLEAGKLADLVILDRNPLKVDPRQIDEIRVLETLKEGETIYRAAP